MNDMPATTTPAQGETRRRSEDRRRRVFVKAFGCQMNVYDGERMVDVLRARGFERAREAREADLVILNTCHIREKAAEKVYSELGRLRLLRERHQSEGRRLAISVAGCVAQAEGEAMLTRAPAIDFIFGPQGIQRLPELIDRLDNGERHMVATDFETEDKFAALSREEVAPPAVPPAVFLSVQEGCDKFCTFCVVPYTRGAEYSRPAADILREARLLLRKGAREITLIGQNVNAWHGEAPDGGEWNLARLLEEMAGLEGLTGLRFTTSHPNEMNEELIRAFGENEKLMPYLHLPVQAGSDRILKAMNRRHRAADYLRVIEKLRAAREDIAISGDFIVGFPGETEEDFRATLDLVREVEYAHAYSFRYSPRPGTPAADMQDQVEEDVKAERLRRLQELLTAQQAAFNARFVGQRFPLLLTGRGRHEGQLVGRSPWLQAVHVTAAGHDVGIGDVVMVEVREALKNSLGAHIMEKVA